MVASGKPAGRVNGSVGGAGSVSAGLSGNATVRGRKLLGVPAAVADCMRNMQHRALSPGDERRHCSVEMLAVAGTSQ
jgi:hypothetical protein